MIRSETRARTILFEIFLDSYRNLRFFSEFGILIGIENFVANSDAGIFFLPPHPAQKTGLSTELAKRVQKVESKHYPQKNMHKREGSEFAEEQHGIVVRASWSVVSSMEQCDGERVVAQVAIAIWLRRMMQYREPMNVS